MSLRHGRRTPRTHRQPAGHWTFSTDQPFDPNNPATIAALSKPSKCTARAAGARSADEPVRDVLAGRVASRPKPDGESGRALRPAACGRSIRMNLSLFPKTLPFIQPSTRGDHNNVQPRLGFAWDRTPAARRCSAPHTASTTAWSAMAASAPSSPTCSRATSRSGILRTPTRMAVKIRSRSRRPRRRTSPSSTTTSSTPLRRRPISASRSSWQRTSRSRWTASTRRGMRTQCRPTSTRRIPLPASGLCRPGGASCRSVRSVRRSTARSTSGSTSRSPIGFSTRSLTPWQKRKTT